jgi:hydroxymethylglutaryl-CoA synthase
MAPGIAAVGSYVPAGRMALADVRAHWPGAGGGGPRSVSVADHDEDVVTMAVEAAEAALGAEAAVLAEAALAAGDGHAEPPDALYLATCSSPYAEHSAAAEVARALDLPRDAEVADLAGSTLGGLRALTMAADAVASGRRSRALVVASERRRGAPGTAVEALGAGAVAVLVTAGGGVAVEAGASWRHGVPTRWRPDGAVALSHYDDARYETVEQVRPAVAAVRAALAPAGAEPVTFLALGPVDGRSAGAIAKALELPAPTAGEVDETGDLGAAAVLASLAAVLRSAEPGATGLCIAVEPGAGACGAALRVGGPVPVVDRRPPARPVGYVEFLQRFGALSGPQPPDPIVPHAATPGALRADVAGSLQGSRCARCGSISVPPRRSCIDCGSPDGTLVRAPRRGTVVTFNLQHVVAVHPEPAPLAVGVVRLQGQPGTRGGQVSAMFCEEALEQLAVGAPAELVYRRVGCEAGLVKYGWKARLVVAGEARR